MKRIVWMIFLCAMVITAAAAQDGNCTSGVLTGTWGYTDTGTLITSAGAVPFAVVGRGAWDADGNVVATQTGSLGGQISQDVVKGTSTMNSDCEVAFTVNIYDQSGHLQKIANWVGVIDDNGREFRGILIKLVLVTPSGNVTVPAILTMNARKLSPAR